MMSCVQSLVGSFRANALTTRCIVHEAYMRLLEQEQVDWNNRLHFFSIASQMMRHILLNHAEERNAKKRGSGAAKVQLDDLESLGRDGGQLDIVVFNETLDRLYQLDETQAKFVELRFFGGLTIEEAAMALDISPATVKREWRMAKAWLKVQMQN